MISKRRQEWKREKNNTRILRAEHCMRKPILILGHCIGSGGAMNLSSQLSLAPVLEAKQGGINHGAITKFAAWDVLDEAISTVTNVGKSGGALRPRPTIRVVVVLRVVAAQLLPEHRALRQFLCTGAAGGDSVQANAAFLLGVEPDPCVELAVVVGRAPGH